MVNIYFGKVELEKLYLLVKNTYNLNSNDKVLRKISIKLEEAVGRKFKHMKFMK